MLTSESVFHQGLESACGCGHAPASGRGPGPLHPRIRAGAHPPAFARSGSPARAPGEMRTCPSCTESIASAPGTKMACLAGTLNHNPNAPQRPLPASGWGPRRGGPCTQSGAPATAALPQGPGSQNDKTLTKNVPCNAHEPQHKTTPIKLPKTH